jgi:hypothetical protein
MVPCRSSPCLDYNSRLSDCKQINGIFLGHPKIYSSAYFFIKEAVIVLIEAVKELVEAVRVCTGTLLVQDIKVFVAVRVLVLAATVFDRP